MGPRIAPISRRRADVSRRSIAVVALVVLALAGCTSAPPQPDTTNGTSRFYDQVVHWKTCSTVLQCATAIVPLDWAHPSGPTISIAMAKQRAISGKPQGTILFDPGGPGASGVDFVEAYGGQMMDPSVRDAYDVVGFDPRGIGHSTPIRCYSSAKLEHYYYDVLPGRIGSDQWLAADLKAQDALAKACAKNTGPLLAHVDTSSAARDMDALRAVFGEKKLDYFGGSYGTDLGLEYARLFPQKVGRFLLDSVESPDASGEQLDVGQAKGFETELQQYLAACVPDQSTCPFSGSVADADAQLTSLFATLNAHPIADADGRYLNSANLAIAITSALYSPQLWSDLSSALKAVKTGSAGPAFDLADQYLERSDSGQYPNLIEAYYAVGCLDRASPDTVTAMRSEAADIAKVAPVLGRYLGYSNAVCGVWPYPPAATPPPVTAAGSDPILLVNATNDPATPYAQAQEVASHLANGHLVTRVGDGHGSYEQGYPCIDDIVDRYFLTGAVPASDPMCPSSGT
ncbi:alpha/beta hydrolase [Diaminobutyricibacter sp. McL0618]|uniref:alpha/beta hydrolase n=1 Tax=Leifsonia sp. McL0618 TaxID=3415677 RepID=UPI003CEC580A